MRFTSHTQKNISTIRIVMFFLTCLLLLIGYWYFTRNLKYWKSRGVNGPTPLPIFGNLIEVLFTPRTDLEMKYYQQHGNIYGYYLSDKPVLVVGEPEFVKAIMVKDFHVFPHRRGTDTSHPILKKNLANVVGDDWKRVRSITSPTFTSGKMKQIYPHMDECLSDFMVHLDDLAKKKNNVNIKDIYGNFTLDVIASCFFATKLNSQNQLDSLFVKHAKILLTINPLKMLALRMFPKYVFQMLGVGTDRFTAGEESQSFYVDLVRRMIDNRKESGKKVNDFLQLLMDADQTISNNEIDTESHHINEGKEELEVEQQVLNVKLNSSNKKLDEDEIIAQAFTFLMAGYETTATALTYATYELALNPDLQDKLCDEVNTALNANGSIDYDVLCHLPYLDAVISETLRHHPPIAKTTRIASREYKVGNTGVSVFAGQQVDIPIYAIHHDEKYYSNPMKFDPERFMPYNRHKLVPYTYLPFGGGPRNCIGMRFSLLETKFALAQMVRRYTFFKCSETDVPLTNDPKALLSVPKRAIVGIAMRT